MNARRFLKAAVALGLWAGMAGAALAQAAPPANLADIKARLKSLKPADFPSRPIEFTVGGPAGGGMDTTARLLARKFEEYTDQTAIVNNRVGAGGMVANAWLIQQAPADGHHIGVLANSIVGDSFLRTEGKWSWRDLDSLAFINAEPVVWLTSASGAFKERSLREVLDAARSKPDSVRVSVIPGTLFEMLAEQVEAASGTRLIKVPYPGGTPSINALMGDHIDLSFGFVGEFEAMGERVRPVAVAGAVPSPRLPGVPTFDSVLGTKDTQWLFWRYVAAPKAIAPARRAWLVAALNAALNDPALADDYRKRGGLMDTAGLGTPERVSAELERLAGAERAFYLRTGRMKEETARR